jgi:hypothetical protein
MDSRLGMRECLDMPSGWNYITIAVHATLSTPILSFSTTSPSQTASFLPAHSPRATANVFLLNRIRSNPPSVISAIDKTF